MERPAQPWSHDWPTWNWSGFLHHGSDGHGFCLIKEDNRRDCAAPALIPEGFPITLTLALLTVGHRPYVICPFLNFRMWSSTLSTLFLLLHHIGLLAATRNFQSIPVLEPLCFRPPLPGLWPPKILPWAAPVRQVPAQVTCPWGVRDRPVGRALEVTIWPLCFLITFVLHHCVKLPCMMGRLMSPKIHVQFLAPVSQEVTVLGDRAFREIIR